MIEPVSLTSRLEGALRHSAVQRQTAAAVGADDPSDPSPGWPSLPSMLGAWRQAFPAEPPALNSVAFGGAAPLLAPGARVQWDVIAYAPRRRR